MLQRRPRDTQVHLGGARLRVDPLTQSGPDPHQALVRDVDHRRGAELNVGRRHQEAAAGSAKDVDHRDHFGLAGPGQLAEFLEPPRTAYAARIGAAVGERLEHLLGDELPLRRLELEIRLLGVARQRFRHRPDRLVVNQVDRLSLDVIRLPVLPGPHHRVLQNGQLIGIVADVVEQPQHQPGRDLGATDGDRPGDGVAPLVAVHPRHEILPVVDRLGQPVELGAVADEIRAHRDDDVDRRLLLADGVQQEFHERDGVVVRVAQLAAVLEAEELLKLVGDDEDVLVRRQPRLADALDQARLAAPQRDLEEGLVGLGGIVLPADDVGRVERLGEVSDRIFTWTEDRDAPARPGARHHAAVKRGDEARADERRLAAPGRADHGEEPAAAEPRQDLVDAGFPPEEKVVFVRLETAEAGKRIGLVRVEHQNLGVKLADKLAEGGRIERRPLVDDHCFARPEFRLARRVWRRDINGLGHDRLLPAERSALLDFA